MGYRGRRSFVTRSGRLTGRAVRRRSRPPRVTVHPEGPESGYV